MSTVALERANPREIPKPLLGFCGALIGIGVIALIAGLATSAETTWRAYHVNYIYFAGLSQAGLVVSCALVIIGARWAGPIRHVAEGLAAWVPISLLLFLASFFGKEFIYSNWIHGAPHGKEAWLNIPRLYLMDLAIMGVLTLLTLRYLKLSFRPALQGMNDRAPTLLKSWTENWKGGEQELADSQPKLRVLAPIICLAYAFGYGFIGFDQVMSLEPTWFSNLFAWYFPWGGFLSAVAATALISVLLRKSPGWSSEITKPRMHDLGKMIFAFSIFWMYLFFAQYIVIWYGNLPEETQFFQARLGTQFLQETWTWAWERLDEPYVKLSLTAWAAIWIVPFWVLLGQRPKQTPKILGTVAAIVLFGFWLERNALVWPALEPGQGGSWFGAVQIGIALGFFGAFTLVYLVFSRVFPTLPLPDRS